MNSLETALRRHKEGISVIPLHAPGMPLPTGAQPSDAGKVPLISWKEYQQRLPTEQEIHQWWTRWPDANVGVVTGTVSGLIVLDVDGPVGEQTLQSQPPIPETCRSSTGNGEHIWFNHPGGFVANFAKRLPGLDLRGDGGYVVAPPSVHASGHHYAWTHHDDTALADPPEWLLRVIGPRPMQASRHGSVETITRRAN